jgi:hypothetical protein
VLRTLDNHAWQRDETSVEYDNDPPQPADADDAEQADYEDVPEPVLQCRAFVRVTDPASATAAPIQHYSASGHVSIVMDDDCDAYRVVIDEREDDDAEPIVSHILVAVSVLAYFIHPYSYIGIALHINHA